MLPASATAGSDAGGIRASRSRSRPGHPHRVRQRAWWAEVVFHDWRQRPGPRYAKLAAAILEAIDRKTLREGTRIPLSACSPPPSGCLAAPLWQMVMPTPLAALSPRVIAVGSASKLLWGGLRVGWIRVPDEPLRTALIGRKAALNLAASAISQAITAQLLAGITPGWLSAHRAALTHRRDHLLALLAGHLPAWRVHPPEAGLSVWAELPLSSADAFVHAAARHGVTLTPGAMACVDGKHLGFVRLSFALELGMLELAAERLAAAWTAHAEDLAVAPYART
jgi:hypothetical protein